jgi:4'-phosphopantetheinyl transferase
MPDLDPWLPQPAGFDLPDSVVHVWRAVLDCSEFETRQYEETLAADEMTRAGRFYFPRDRNNFIAARGILRALLGRYLDRPPSDLEFEYGAHGKPSLRETGAAHSAQFNVSHSHGLALLAFSRARHLGVDVEQIRPDIAAEEIAERYFSSQEVAELLGLPPAIRAEAFFRCWTRKEAYVKARGEGLQIPLKSFHVSLTPAYPARLSSTDSHRWSLHSLRPTPQSVGAIVVEGQDSRILCYDWNAVTAGQ